MEENHVLETAAELGIIVLAYSPLGRGSSLLSSPTPLLLHS